MDRNTLSNNFNYPVVSRESGMEINNHFSHINRKDIPHTSPLSSPILTRRDISSSLDQQLQAQLVTLKQQHDLQQHMLMQQYQEQQHKLASEHQMQMEEHIKISPSKEDLAFKRSLPLLAQARLFQLQAVPEQMLLVQKQQEYLEQQKKLEEATRIEKDRQERHRIEQLKNKKKDQESAVASSEVKLKLAEFVLNKKQREAMGANHSPPQFRHWAVHHNSLEQSSPPQSGLSPPYRHPGMLGQYDDDFPLRKTASEPNLKVRSVLKQKVLDRRSSPLLRRKDRTPLPLKRKTPLTIDTTLSCHSNPDSGPNSPPNGSAVGSSGSISSLHKEELGPLPLQMMKNMVGQGGDMLYASPSLPNISLGRPANPSSSSTTAEHSEAELRALGAARFGLPLTGHMMPSTLPYFPSLPVIDGEHTSPTAPGNQAYLSAQMKALEQTQSPGKMASGFAGSRGITDAQVAHARLHRHRPLGRTQSAPLPLQHPLLQQQNLLAIQQQHQEQLLKENQKHYLKQHLRQAVLQRSSSKNHMENVDEETEVKLAQEMRETRDISRSRDKLEEEDVMIVNESPSKSTDSRDEDQQAFLYQQRELLRQYRLHDDNSHDSTENMRSAVPSHVHPPPLNRTHSSPIVKFSTTASSTQSQPQTQQSTAEDTTPVTYTYTTGIAYDNAMLKHQCVCGNNNNHIEHAGRLQSIWARLQESHLVDQCEKIKTRKATMEELQSCHAESHTILYGTNPVSKIDPKVLENLHVRFCMLQCGGVGIDSDTVWNDNHTAMAARVAAGCVTELSLLVGSGELKNGFAIVRPPGHHAEENQPMGFCYFNSIAIAAKQLRLRLKTKKVLIVDWDVHHGNSTQQQFYDDPNVLYLSLHRYEGGSFFPGTGSPEDCGSSSGLGYNVNIAWSGGPENAMGDAEYLAAFRSIVMPIAREFGPEVVLVSAGFDAAAGHPAPLGGYNLSAACFGYMTKQLQTLADGKLVLALEGGYDLPSICDASEMCVKALLGEEIPQVKEEELVRLPNKNAIETMENCVRIQANYWSSVKRHTSTIACCYVEAQRREREETDTVTALASLSMVTAKQSSVEEGSLSPAISEPMEES
ncbi:unnamed protein product [Owenia fusiformis]|uniref:Histone deacetylase n=1 Tax=Owenia fusiformis TaxID=6347 RepID=A0A8J1TUU9_OWEFU|nr:unnamed protein product [Owenia fusiformis]